MSAAVHVRICRGRDCQSNREHMECLITSIDTYQAAERIKCQDICKGPVVVVRKGKSKFWFKRLVGPTLLGDLRRFIEEGSMSAALVDVLVKKK